MDKTNLFRWVALLGVAFLAFIVRGPGDNEEIKTFLSVSSFFFGIFLAFATSNCHSRYSKIIDNLKNEEATFLFCYYSAKSLGKSSQERIRDLIDQCLTTEIDYKLVDYKKTAKPTENLLSYVQSLQPENAKEEQACNKILDLLKDILITRKQTEVAISQPLSHLEWFTVIGLLMAIIGSILYINSGSALSIITAILITSVALLLVFVLQDIDRIAWKEQGIIWESVGDTFIKMGLLPYFPDKPLLSGKVDLSRFEDGQKFRVAVYSKPYPNMEKDIKLLINTPELRSKNLFKKFHKPIPWVES